MRLKSEISAEVKALETFAEVRLSSVISAEVKASETFAGVRLLSEISAEVKALETFAWVRVRDCLPSLLISETQKLSFHCIH